MRAAAASLTAAAGGDSATLHAVLVKNTSASRAAYNFLLFRHGACRAAVLEQECGIQAHAVMDGLDRNAADGTALVHAYGKIWVVDNSQNMFKESAGDTNLIMWNAVLTAHTQVTQQCSSVTDTAVLANVYSAAGRTDEMAGAWTAMRDQGVRKQEVEKLGYKEADKGLQHHSERLSLAYGLIIRAVPPGKMSRIVMNLRICANCHEIFKYASKVIERVIVVRDANRYHTIKQGTNELFKVERSDQNMGLIKQYSSKHQLTPHTLSSSSALETGGNAWCADLYLRGLINVQTVSDERILIPEISHAHLERIITATLRMHLSFHWSVDHSQGPWIPCFAWKNTKPAYFCCNQT
ncbi:hypothetical protein GUJ93_ZPchr0006g41828 [Zizania palustris]|uniref:DYW domain-containing protein n=1 Tax=Zizania palustris TaxID=103762 RepID=A0A8J5T9N4_ZIZPA|nr:hypothetical protein GUJ93_ZPchr0006g41828 [Zizania palustris]